MINTNLPFLMNTLNTRLIYGKGLEVSMCKGTKESTGRFAPHLADAHRTLKPQRPGRRQRWHLKLKLEEDCISHRSHLSWHSSAEVRGASCVCHCSASLGSHGAVPDWHKTILPSCSNLCLWNCTCCILIGSLEDARDSPPHGRVLWGIPK